jgi:hypothetical protein
MMLETNWDRPCASALSSTSPAHAQPGFERGPGKGSPYWAAAM